MTASTALPVSLARVQWLARRGMLELDIWLNRFIEQHFAALHIAEQQRFVYLLQQDDMTLYDWLTGQVLPPAELETVVNALKERPNLRNTQKHTANHRQTP